MPEADMSMSGADGGPPAKRTKGDETPTEVQESPTTTAQLKAALAAALAANKEKDEVIAGWCASAKRRSLQTLLNLEESQFQLDRRGTDNSHVNGPHENTDATEKEFKILRIERDMVPLDSTSKIVLRLIEQDCRLPLTFKRLPYWTEADIATLVNEVLHDAIAILGHLGVDIGDLAVTQERSLFSGRPDIMVVRSSTHQLPLLIAEAKKPLVGGGLCNKVKPLSQAFDYSESLRACGHPLPFVVLTSLEESCVCWNSENSENSEPMDLYAQGSSATNCPPTPQKEKASSTSTTATPPMLRSLQTISCDEEDLGFVPATERVLSRSKVFKAYQLVHVLYTALRRVTHPPHATDKTIDRLKLGHTYHFPKVLRFISDKKSYTWGSLTARVGSTISSRASPKTKQPIDKADEVAYYLIGRLGRGATSNVWHALDSNNNEVVIKMYVKTTNKDGHKFDDKGFDEEARRATEKEAELLTSFYRFLEGKVHCVKLAGFHCVVMPFFEPVKKEERKKALVAVEEVLRTVFVKDTNRYKYDDDDVRWRHVGTYVDHSQKTHHILYDLADLVCTEVNDESCVRTHLNTLKQRMGEQKTTSEPFAHEEVSSVKGRRSLSKNHERIAASLCR